MLYLLSLSGASFVCSFVDEQDQRRKADYNPNATFPRDDAINIIANAQRAIGQFPQLRIGERGSLNGQSMLERR